ncbi:MAG: ral nucleoside transport system permease protein [Thermotogaceae bacterium]|jgi:simple sugar transport system permease protein|nr:ral nucleoside transport system permease protein [Thermotogaceae bacterium]
MNKKQWMRVAIPIISIIISLLIASIIIIWIGEGSFTDRIDFLVEAYTQLIKGAFGNKTAVMNTIIKMTPLILTGLAVGFGFRAGVFNIGAEGQMAMGALTATIFAVNAASLPSFIAIPLTMIVGMLAGAVWAGIAGFLKATTGAHEVISTIMLNWIAYNITNWAVTGPFNAGGGIPKSPEIASSAKLPNLLTSQASFMSFGILIAITAAVVMYIILYKTSMGYEVKAVGFNPFAAEYGGINVSKNIIVTMAISGALAGLAGTLEATGLYYRFYGTLSSGKGFDGISIALIGQNNPFGILAASLLIGALRTGSNQMQFAGVPKHIVMIIQSIIIFLVAAERMVMTIMGWNKKKGAK